MALADANDGGTPYMGISPGRARLCTHWPARERTHQRASFGCTAAQYSLGKNVSKEVCFWLWGKDNLVQLPKRTQRYVNSRLAAIDGVGGSVGRYGHFSYRHIASLWNRRYTILSCMVGCGQERETLCTCHKLFHNYLVILNCACVREREPGSTNNRNNILSNILKNWHVKYKNI